MLLNRSFSAERTDEIRWVGLEASREAKQISLSSCFLSVFGKIGGFCENEAKTIGNIGNGVASLFDDKWSERDSRI